MTVGDDDIKTIQEAAAKQLQFDDSRLPLVSAQGNSLLPLVSAQGDLEDQLLSNSSGTIFRGFLTIHLGFQRNSNRFKFCETQFGKSFIHIQSQ
jgi:hypothetical protein